MANATNRKAIETLVFWKFWCQISIFVRILSWYGTSVFDFLQFVWTKLVVKGQGGFNDQGNCPMGSNLENQEQSRLRWHVLVNNN